MSAAAKARRRTRRLQRWTSHLALWVVVGGALGVTHCHRRYHAIARGTGAALDAIPLLEATPPLIHGTADHRSGARHIVGL